MTTASAPRGSGAPVKIRTALTRTDNPPEIHAGGLLSREPENGTSRCIRRTHRIAIHLGVIERRDGNHRPQLAGQNGSQDFAQRQLKNASDGVASINLRLASASSSIGAVYSRT